VTEAYTTDKREPFSRTGFGSVVFQRVNNLWSGTVFFYYFGFRKRKIKRLHRGLKVTIMYMEKQKWKIEDGLRQTEKH
jgi:hypothetical protein